MEHENYVPA